MIRKAIVLILLGAFGLTSTAWAGTYSGGTGEPNDPYRIATPNDLNDIGNHIEDYNKCFVMVNDINLADYTGTQFNIIGRNTAECFRGVFDGNNHTISNFTYSSNADGIGIFCVIDDPNARIKDLTLSEPNIDGNGASFLGSLVARLLEGEISNCEVKNATIRGDSYVGSLIGRIGFDGTVKIVDCRAIDIEVSGTSGVGGLIGDCWMGYGTIIVSKCSASGIVSGSVHGYYTGGLAGEITSDKGFAEISECSFHGTVSGRDQVGGLVGAVTADVNFCSSQADVTGYDYVGGLIGDVDQGKVYPTGTIFSCHAQGTVLGSQYVGGLTGQAFDIIQCYASGEVFGGDYVGGLTGWASYVENCHSRCDVTGFHYVGGLVGTAVEICHSWATGSVGHHGSVVGGLAGRAGDIKCSYATGKVSGYFSVGGLAGENWGNVSSCCATGDVSGPEECLSGDDLGGLIGVNDQGNINNCYSTGNIVGMFEIGGLVGYNDGSISNSYAAGSVSGESSVGNLVGYHCSGSYNKCFWNTEINPDVNGIGNTTDPNVIGKTTDEMQTESTFTDADWDFVDVWDIGENQTYPFLRVHPAGDIDHDDKVNFFDFAILASHWLEEK